MDSCPNLIISTSRREVVKTYGNSQQLSDRKAVPGYISRFYLRFPGFPLFYRCVSGNWILINIIPLLGQLMIHMKSDMLEFNGKIMINIKIIGFFHGFPRFSHGFPLQQTFFNNGLRCFVAPLVPHPGVAQMLDAPSCRRKRLEYVGRGWNVPSTPW